MGICRHFSLVACWQRAAGVTLLLFGTSAWGATAIVTVQPRVITEHLRAYAEVEPIAVVRLRAAQAGVIRGLTVVPGEVVNIGSVLGRLQGPEIDARLAQRRAAVDSQRAALQAARHSLAIQRQKRAAQLGTRLAVYQAEASVAQAKARLAAAQAGLQAAESTTALHAPANGAVTSLAVANGERVAAGQTLVTVQPAHRLWLRAAYYGSDARAVHVGMHGRFFPADGSPAIAVTVASILPAEQADGGLPVIMRAAADDLRWISGEFGVVIVKGAKRSVVAVPTRALVMDQGRWWVLVDTRNGDRRQAVTPGPSRGDQTLIEHGLVAGTRVIVGDAYLRFHRDFSQHYQPPD